MAKKKRKKKANVFQNLTSGRLLRLEGVNPNHCTRQKNLHPRGRKVFQLHLKSVRKYANQITNARYVLFQSGIGQEFLVLSLEQHRKMKLVIVYLQVKAFNVPMAHPHPRISPSQVCLLRLTFGKSTDEHVKHPIQESTLDKF